MYADTGVKGDELAALVGAARAQQLSVGRGSGSLLTSIMEDDVRCAFFFDRNFHSRMPLEFHAFAPLEALPCL